MSDILVPEMTSERLRSAYGAFAMGVTTRPKTGG